MQVHAEDAVDAGGDDEVRHELRGDGHAPLVLAVLAGVAVVGDDRRDALRARALEAVDVDQQLHQVVVDGLAGREHDVDVASAHIFLDLDHGLAIGETRRGAEPHRQVEVRADALRELARARAREDLEVVAVARAHRVPPAIAAWRFLRIESTSASCTGSLTERTSSGGTASTAATARPSLRSSSNTSVR